MDSGDPRRQGGFTYLALLVAVTLLGIGLAATGTLWSLAARRAKETELLFIGHQFRTAIARYRAAAGGGLQYPHDLQDLLEDRRFPIPRHHLRRLWRDPMTGRTDWETIRGADGGIIGVASRSRETPVKRTRFNLEDASFEDKNCYCDWQFVQSLTTPPPRRRVKTAQQ